MNTRSDAYGAATPSPAHRAEAFEAGSAEVVRALNEAEGLAYLRITGVVEIGHMKEG